VSNDEPKAPTQDGETRQADPPPPPREPTPLQKRLDQYRDRLVDMLVFAVPSALLPAAVAYLVNPITAQPWQALWIVVPLGVAVAFLWRHLRGRTDMSLRGGFLLFLILYLAAFGVAATADLGVWSRQPTQSVEAVDRRFTPSWAGDWRYKMVPKRAESGLLVVTMPPQPDSTTARVNMGQLIELARTRGALGIAFDAYFGGSAPTDGFLCEAVALASEAELPVFAGYGFEGRGKEKSALGYPAALEACLPRDEAQGHLIGLVDGDGKVRTIPLFFLRPGERPSLSLRVATGMGMQADSAELRRIGLLRYLPPSDGVPIRTLQQINEGDDDLLEDRFVLVGDDSQAETFRTPFGPRLGVIIHAWAVHSLRTGHFLRPTAWWSGFLLLLVSCYYLTVQARNRVPTKRLLAQTAWISVGVIALSVVALFFSYWVDVIYLAVGTWLLTLLLIGLRSSLRETRGDAATTGEA
jgi:hypothetical protein